MKSLILIAIVVALSACASITPSKKLTPEMRQMMFDDVIHAVAQPRF